MKNIIKIGNRKIGEKFKPFIICELGINHNFSLKLAKKMVDIAIKSEADAIKKKQKIKKNLYLKKVDRLENLSI